ncbi:MAG: aminotransferase class III-fold pyridoxal phosphate-dependent enzyme, partial [Bacteroidota bacterium]
MTHIQETDAQLVWHPYTSLKAGPPIHITSAHGMYLNTANGRKIMDAVSSWWVNIHGHSHPALAEAVYKQALTAEHIIFAGFTHEPAVTLAAKLQPLLPGNMAKFFFSDDGSTAVEVALKLAMQFNYNQGISKRKIIALEGAYHGDTFGAMSVAERNAFNAAFSPWMFDTEFLTLGPADRCPDIHTYDANQWEPTIAAMQRICESGDVAAFIFEPLLQGTAGMRLYPVEVLEQLLEIAEKYNVISIADEVMTGFGRTGPLFAM